MSVRIITMTPDAEWLIEYAARACYDSTMLNVDDEEGRRRFVRNLIEKGHESVLEHASATFEICCSRVASHQLVRHRLASYSQESQRYVKQFGEEIYAPASVLVDDHWRNEFDEIFYKCYDAYHDMVDKGIPKEDARYILPSAMPTKIIMTANFREWRHIIKVRTSDHAQKEIRDIAKDICSLLKEYAPSVFGDLYHAVEE